MTSRDGETGAMAAPGDRATLGEDTSMTRTIVGIAGALVVVGLVGVSDASAQARRRPQAQPAYARVDVQRTISRLERSSDRFRETVDRQLDRSRLNGSRREDRINEEIKQLENALDRLRNEVDRGDRYDEARRHVERAMRESDEVNSLFRRGNFGREAEREWNGIRGDLNSLAVTFNLRPLR
jgi:hypothetical protein